MADININCIMNLVRSAGNDKLKTMGDSADPVCKATRSNKSGKDEEVNVVFTEVPEFILVCIEAAVKNIREEQDVRFEELNTKYNTMKTELEEKIEEKDKLITGLRKEVREHKFEVDALAQYTRSENFKIHGIEYKKGEDTNEIVKKVAKYAGVSLTDRDISVSHRLMSKEQMDKNITAGNSDKNNSAIIVRVDKRDFKSKMLEARRNLAQNPDCPAEYKAVTMYEDVTPLRSRIMYALRHRNNKTAFKFVWSKGGRIYARTHDEAVQDPQPRPHIINTPDDLAKIGFSEQEIEEIIKKRQPQH